VEGLVRGHLADDEQRDSRRQIAPQADTQCEQERGRQALEPAEAGEDAEQQAGGAPDGEEDEQRDRGAARELVER
jgi:hypothetical protein